MTDISISKKAKKKAAKNTGSRTDGLEAIRAMRAEFHTDDTAAEEKPKKGLKKLILAGFALLVIGAGAGGAWYFLMQPPQEEAEIVEAPVGDFPKSYIRASAVHISYQTSGGKRRRLVVYLSLEVEQRDDNPSDVKQALPRLQEAFWRTLNAAPLPGAERGAIDLAAVKARVLVAAEEVLGPNIVQDILIRDARTVNG